MIFLSEEIPGNRVLFTHPTCTRSVFERVTITPSTSEVGGIP